jgi:hypothetical protein
MVHDRSVDVILEGHSDPLGDAEYNKLLSLERAIWARNRLVSYGVSASRIQAVGLGSSRTAPHPEDSPSANRRVEARFVPHGSIRIEEPKRVEPPARVEDAHAPPAVVAEAGAPTVTVTVEDAGAPAVAPQPVPVPAKPDAGDDPWTP